MKRVLIVATVGRFFDFLKNDINVLKDLGYEVHCATNLHMGENDSMDGFEIIKHQVDFQRSPFSMSNLKAYKQISALLEEYEFDLIHCHTPVGGVVARLAARKLRKQGLKVIYTAHGFHFFKGATIKNWLIFYPVEKLLSRYTDVLITINKEDFNIASKKFKAKQVTYIPGVGVDTKKFDSNIFNKSKIRDSLGFDDNDCIMISVGELSARKNHKAIINALAKLPKADLERIKYLIVGIGDLDEYLHNLCCELKLDNVVFLGYRTDVAALYACSDIFVFPSLQEGLPVALMEAMASGLPVVCSRIRGNVDLIENNKGGYLVDPTNEDGYAEGISRIINYKNDKVAMGAVNIETMKRFDVSAINERIIEIYSSINKPGD